MPRTSSISRTLPTSRTGRSSRNSKPNNIDIETEENEEGGIDLELGVSVAGMGASISTKGVLKIGIGVAAVELDLKEPNNSKLSYVWDLYQIEGKRNGCSVVLTYSIGGIEVKKETRQIPECEKPEPEPEPEPEPDPGNPSPSKLPFGHPMDIVFRVLPGSGYDEGWAQWKVLQVEETYSDNRPKTFKSITTENRAFVNYYRSTSRTKWDLYAWPPISQSDPRWNYDWEDIWTFRSPGAKGYIPTAVSLYQWFHNVNFRYVGWEYERYVGFEGPRWWVDNETVNYFVLIEYQQRLGNLNWRTLHTNLSYYPGQFHIYCEHIIKKHSSPLPRGVPPIRGKDKMNDCCKMTAALYEVFAVEEILSNGIKFPNRLIAAGAKDYSEVFNYLDFLSLVVREIDHLGIHPHEVTIKDVDPGTPGDQKISAEFVNATAWAQSLMENSLKNDGEAGR
ncbi:MAG: hypothetical protein KA714_10705 [Limnoraphis sp. WC205]|nr:hypothetical protein [Limnoraphis sp. WC205]